MRRLAGAGVRSAFANQPVARRYALIASALAHLVPGAPFIQFSYGWTPPVPAGKDFTVETRVSYSPTFRPRASGCTAACRKI